MFEKLVGNEQVKKYLKETIDTSLISHSYMFIGKEGVGKKLFATEYAKSILCETKEDIAKLIEEQDKDKTGKVDLNGFIPFFKLVSKSMAAALK